METSKGSRIERPVPRSGIRDTLLLDQGYQPLRVISWRRAICMSFLGKVEMVAAHERPIYTVDREYAAPAVVRLLGPYRPQQYVIRFSREGVHLRDRYTCQYCKQRLTRRELTLDHVMPRHRGGPTSWENVVTACSPCNLHKGGRTPGEANMRLDVEPRRPRWVPPSRAALGLEEVPACWRDWLPRH
ncbi:HNH endonuclease [Pseudenhygromyxa sp. WMMC2535]|uniref:HNH endonuclease n=1 Tax=Pseudenhygromyxa sp. WMMC2535 TaxID=2712867 RepID=UPI0020D1BB76|nr:HNH endonuclease [Pseudenhygromyxa sp. WMMC2535]